jgi:hypothetical protein
MNVLWLCKRIPYYKKHAEVFRMKHYLCIHIKCVHIHIQLSDWSLYTIQTGIGCIFFLRYWGLNPRQVLYHLSYSNSPITIFLTFLYFENFHEKLKEKRTTTYLHIIHTYKVLTHRQYFVLYTFNLGLLWTLGIRQR